MDMLMDRGALPRLREPADQGNTMQAKLTLSQVIGAVDQGQLVHLSRQAPRAARFANLCRPLPPSLVDRLPPTGLWSHQAQALDLARTGQSVAVATATASGKSLCFQLPVAEATLNGSGALLVYPTKALAHDQLRSLAALEVPGLVAATYDGDSSAAERAWTRRHANVVLTNPDMLHSSILPNHGSWGTFLMRLAYVVVDELHILRGIFGSHVAHVLRRLRRLCRIYRSSPTFIFGSATVGQPAELASALCGSTVRAVTDDGSPLGERLMALWNPPLLDTSSGARASSDGQTADLLTALVGAGYRVIAFARSRRSAEMVCALARRRLPDRLTGSVAAYRGGFLPAQRRQVEADLASGRLRGVVTTNALELGMDIAGLDACLIDGFPGTIASLRQQAGRAGRSRRQSLTVLVAGADALDQWYINHPQEVHSRPAEPAVVNPSNPFVLGPQLSCAAHELPLDRGDERWWGAPQMPVGTLDEAVRALVVADQLIVRASRAIHAGNSRRPAQELGLRNTSTCEYRILCSEGDLVGTVDEARAFTTVHPGAIYLHQGQPWLVEELDLEERIAWVVRTDSTDVTRARAETRIAVLNREKTTTVGRASLNLGPVEVIEQVTGYRRRPGLAGARDGSPDGGRGCSVECLRPRVDVSLDLPATRLATRALWYGLDDSVLADAGLQSNGAVQGGFHLGGSLHAAEHAAIAILPLFAMCDRWDVGGASTARLAGTGQAGVVIYDGHTGGSGVAELGYGAGCHHLEATLEAMTNCQCRAGCPSCVQSPKCGNLNDSLDKAGAVALLTCILGG